MQTTKTWFRPALSGLVLLTIAHSPARADVIADWNVKAEAIAIEKGMTPPPNARGMAMLHVAMFEAVNAVERRYMPYKFKLPVEGTVSKEAAAAAAAYAVLLALHPDRQASLNTTLMAHLGAIAEDAAKAKGIELGKKAAAEVLALRAEDGSDAAETYRPHTVPGVYVPTVIPVFSTYGAVSPWVMKTGSQFRPAPPPALNSKTWTDDLNEIREYGGRKSTKRTDEQATIGRFWFVTGPQTWNPMVRQLAAAKKLDLVDNARLFALVAMAADDAFIAVLDAKYHYNLWRPVTAIRNADRTGNPATPRDESWLPLGDTPMHPEYPCAHCITASAVGTVLKSEFGNDIPEVSMSSVTASGITHRWTRIDDYTNEVSHARIYAGFHYRFSTKVGEEMGRKIAELVVSTQLRSAAASAEPPR